MSLNPYRRSPTWEKITQLIEERNRKMEEVRRLYNEAREIDNLVSQLRAEFKQNLKRDTDRGSKQNPRAA